jgi:transposase
METRSPYQTDVSDEEWAFVAPYLTLLPEDASQRKYPLREVFNGVRYIVKSGAHWRLMPHDLPPWPLVYQQMRRWMDAGCFEAIVQDLRILLRRVAERPEPPSAVILDARTIQSTPRVAREPAMTGTNAARARRCMSQWTRWDICWRCW